MNTKFVKTEQLSEAKVFIDGFVDNPNSNVFITGNSNIKSTDAFLYPTLINILNVKDTFNHDKSVLDASIRKSNDRVDYILVENPETVGYSYITITFGENSDHRAVIGKFYI